MTAVDSLPIPSLSRLTTQQTSLPNSTPSFILGSAHKSYRHQFANIYFIRLRLLRNTVYQRAKARWKHVAGPPELVPRVLEVVKSQLCIIIGTVYMEMPLKPNVLEDVARDRSIPAQPPIDKYHSPDDLVMLEDESGRIQLVGDRIAGLALVTGVIMGALGRENSSGEFEVFDVCFAGMAPMAPRTALKAERDMDVDGNENEQWIALVSGLSVGKPSPTDLRIQMLVEYLSAESGGELDQSSASKIARLIVAGNSLAPVEEQPLPETFEDKKSKRYGQEQSNFDSGPTNAIGAHLLDIARAMPVHLLAGATDPSGVLLPQQPLPRAMFGPVSKFASFSCETNPAWLGIGGRLVHVNAGQPLEDMFKYVPSPPVSRLQLATETLRWRHVAPTAPDTLWCYPYFTADPFIMQNTPDVYVIGNQPEFGTCVAVGEGDEAEGGERRSRVVLLPSFVETGTMVLVNVGTLAVKTVTFDVDGIDLSADGGLND